MIVCDQFSSLISYLKKSDARKASYPAIDCEHDRLICTANIRSQRYAMMQLVMIQLLALDIEFDYLL